MSGLMTAVEGHVSLVDWCGHGRVYAEGIEVDEYGTTVGQLFDGDVPLHITTEPIFANDGRSVFGVQVTREGKTKYTYSSPDRDISVERVVLVVDSTGEKIVLGAKRYGVEVASEVEGDPTVHAATYRAESLAEAEAVRKYVGL